MNKLEHTYITMGKFLSMASSSKILMDFYGDEIPKEKMMVIIKNLRDISNDYLYPKYILKDGSLLVDEADYENCRAEPDNTIPEKQGFEITLFNNDYKADSSYLDTTIYDDVDGY